MGQVAYIDNPAPFWEKVDQSGGADACWPWTGARAGNGYGRAGKNGYAHRLAALLAHGPCPDGQEVRHLCGKRLCCNPEHLAYGTRAENAADAVRHGTHYSPWTRAERARHGFASGGPCW